MVDSAGVLVLDSRPVGNDVEEILAELLAGVVGVESVPVDSNFFDDLGADSLVMAQFCARVRKRADLPSVSMKDVYQHPTVARLAAALAGPAPAPAPAPPAQAELPAPVGKPRYVLSGTLQFAIVLGYSYLVALVLTAGNEWIFDGLGVVEVYLRSLLVGGASFAALCLFPIVVKWVLVGRWRPRQIRVWSLAYVRFWVVRTLVRANPLVLFAGTPLYALYLRALGAKIGRGAVILSRSAPVCTDLLTVGDGTVIRPDALFPGYRAEDGVIRTGSVTIGADVYVGEATVLDIDTSIGDGAQLGRSSSLHAGQAVPAGERWHGSPAQRTDVDYRTVPTGAVGRLRRVSYPATQLLTLLLVYLPLGFGGAALLLAEVPQLAALLAAEQVGLTSATFYRDAAAGGSVLFFGALAVGLLVVTTVPRLLHRALVPDRVYPLYGFHYGVARTITRLTNVKLFTRIFGDSSSIVGYLSRLGWDLGEVEQTGSNFGTEVRQENPFLSAVGSGTMVADGLSVINTEYSSTSFRVSPVAIGPRNFLGNRIVYPAGGRTGDNCLLATKVMVPVDGPVRKGVGLLGSPPFEIPRTVERDTRFDELKAAEELRRLLPAKNRHNLATIGLFLLVRWVYVIGLVLLTGIGLDLYDAVGAVAVAADLALTPLYTAAYFVLVERITTAVHRLRPLYCSIYDRDFWRRERYWKVPAEVYLKAFDGTPFKNVIWWLLGVRIGRRVFDDGCYLTERSLVTIGDGVTLNAGSVVQCHSQEDGTFKSDASTLGAGCTVGVGAFVHYGVTVGDGAVLAPDSFLMKGEDVPAGARWGGNPARPLDAALAAAPPAVPASPARERPALAAVPPASTQLTATEPVAAPVVEPEPGGSTSSDPASGQRPAPWPFLAAATAVVVVAGLTLLGLDQRVATAGEAALAAAAATHPRGALAPPAWADLVAVPQLAALDALVAVPGQAVVDTARTALLAASLLCCLLLWPVARRIGLSGTGAALAVVLCGLPAPVVAGLVGSVDAGALAALWLAVAAALAGRGRAATVTGAGAAVLACLTAPLAAVGMLAFGAHRLLTGRRVVGRLLGVVLAGGAGAVAALVTGLWPAGAALGSGRGPVAPALLVGALAVGAAVLVLAWSQAPALRPAVTATAAVLACAAVPGAHVTTALLLAVPALAVLAAAAADALPARRALLAAALAAGAVGAGPLVAPAVAPAPDRSGLTAWVATQLDPAAVLQVDPLTGAQLRRDGIAAERLVPASRPAPPGALAVVAARSGTAPPAGARVLVAVPDGPGGGPVTVVAPDPGPDPAAERRRLEARLVGNRALVLAPAAARALQEGAVDPRLATALSGLATTYRLTVVDFAAVPGEPADALRRVARITQVDGRPVSVAGTAEPVQRWLASQRPASRPAAAAVEDGVLTVRYTAPSPLAPPGR